MSGRIGWLCLSMTLLMGLLSAGCIDDGRPLPVLIAFGTYPLGESCELTVQGDENIKYSPSGMLDINHPFFEGEPYFILGAQVHNYMNDPTTNEGGSKYDVLLERFEVKYRWLVGSELLQDNPAALAIEGLDYSEDTTGFVPSATSYEDPGRAVFAGTVLPKEVGSILKIVDPLVLDELVLAIDLRVYGRTVGGAAVKSNKLLYPIFLCRDCLASQEAGCWPGEKSFGPQ